MIRVPKLKIVYICLEEKCKFFMNYDKWLQQSRNFDYGPLTPKCYGFQRFANGPYQGRESGLY